MNLNPLFVRHWRGKAMFGIPGESPDYGLCFKPSISQIGTGRPEIWNMEVEEKRHFVLINWDEKFDDIENFVKKHVVHLKVMFLHNYLQIGNITSNSKKSVLSSIY